MGAILLSLPSLFLVSCGDSKKETSDTDLYYPVQQVLDQQVDSLKKTSDVWLKTVTDDEGNQQKTLIADSVDWKTELALFYDLNPNKKAYAGKFRIDTSLADGDDKLITYTADGLKLAMLNIRIDGNGDPKAIYGDLNTSNLFYDSQYQLSFIPYRAFGINATQNLHFFESAKVFSVTWTKQDEGRSLPSPQHP